MFRGKDDSLDMLSLEGPNGMEDRKLAVWTSTVAVWSMAGPG